MNIHLYIFVVNISPIVYSPATNSTRHQPKALVFYEPGHNCSVSSSSGRLPLVALSTLSSSATGSEPTDEQSSSASSSVSSHSSPSGAPSPLSPGSTSSLSSSAPPFVPTLLSFQCSTSPCVQAALMSHGTSHTSQLSRASQ